MSRIVYVNGSFVPEADAKVSVFDRAFLFAEGVYEVTAVVGGRPLDLEAHLARLDRSLAEMEISPPLTHDELRALHRELIARNDVDEGIVYLEITRGDRRSRLSLSGGRRADGRRLHPEPAAARQPLCRKRRQGDHHPRNPLEAARYQIDRPPRPDHGQAGGEAPRRL